MLDKKDQIRKEILKRLNNQAGKKAFEKSRKIKQKLFSLPEFKKAKIVMFYASKDEEVSTDEMIDEALEAGKQVALPRCTGLKKFVPKEIRSRQKDLRLGTYGIYEPKAAGRRIEPERIDLLIVPGVAFDEKNTRLGRGKGYYDRFLKDLPRGKIKIGLAFRFQILKDLPKDSHDIPVSKVITD